MIEILCIAAEVTAVLLVLSIAIPAAATKRAPVVGVVDDSHGHSKLLQDCENSLIALRSLLYLQASHSVASAPVGRMQSDTYSEVLHRLRDHLETIEPLYASSNLDSITKLPIRSDFEKLLSEASQWAPFVDVSTWVALIQVDNLEQLDDEHGPMASELLLRETANFLRDRIGGIGPLARFNHCGFAIALHGWSPTSAIELLESIRREFSQLTVTVGEAAIASTASASAALLDLALSFDATWERLEDGMAEAVTKGANRGRWFDSSENSWRPMGAESEEATPHDLKQSAESSETDSTETPEVASTPSDSLPSAEASTKPPSDQRNEKPVPPSESSGETLVADDIASLFKAAQASKRASAAEPTSEAPARSPENETPAAESESKENDIQDDIAALFKAARAFKNPANAAEGDAKKPEKKPTDEPEESPPVATNDDIESLFAAFKKGK